jgi:hypothetical protein
MAGSRLNRFLVWRSADRRERAPWPGMMLLQDGSPINGCLVCIDCTGAIDNLLNDKHFRIDIRIEKDYDERTHGGPASHIGDIEKQVRPF